MDEEATTARPGAWFSDSGLINLAGLFEETAARNASEPALIAAHERLSFEQLERITRYLAAALREQFGLAKGQRLAVLAPAPEQLICMLAGWRLGVTVVPLRPDLAPAQLLDELQLTQPSVLLTHRPVSGILQRLDTPPEVIRVPPGKRFSGWLRSLALRRSAVTGETDLHQLVYVGRQFGFEPEEPARDSVAMLAASEGGERLMITHRNLLAAMAQVASDAQEAPAGPVLAAEPLDDAINLMFQVLLPWVAGQPCVLVAGRSTARVLAMARRWNCVCVYAREATVQRWHQQGLDQHLSKLALRCWWDSPLATTPPQRHSGFHRLGQRMRWLRASPHWPVFARESGHSARGARRASVLPGISVGVASDNSQADGAEGVLWMSGAQLMAGFWQSPQHTVRQLTADGWLKTGLRVRMDTGSDSLRLVVKDPAASLTLSLNPNAAN